jgi:hypothetical protein
VTSEEATVAVIDALAALAVPYMLVGSFASNFYGVPRSTGDADFVLSLEGASLEALISRLGPRFRLDPQGTFEGVTGSTRYIIHLADNHFLIELFLLTDDAHDQERFARRRRERVLGREAFLPTPEDVVVTKLRWALAGKRTKDRDDARNVIAVQRSRLDWDYVGLWCDRHGTRELLDDIRRSIAPT